MRFSLSERTFRFGSGLDMSQALVTHEIVGAFQMNQYLIGCTRTGKAAMIDPGDARASHRSEQMNLEIKPPLDQFQLPSRFTPPPRKYQPKNTNSVFPDPPSGERVDLGRGWIWREGESDLYGAIYFELHILFCDPITRKARF